MKALIAGLTLVCFTSAYADGLQYIPKWHMAGGEACYDLEGAKKLVVLDGQFSLCREQEARFGASLSLYKDANGKLDLALKEMTSAVTVSQDLNKKLTTDLKRCIDEKAVAGASSGWSTAWPILGGVGLFLAGLATGWYVISRP